MYSPEADRAFDFDLLAHQQSACMDVYAGVAAPEADHTVFDLAAIERMLAGVATKHLNHADAEQTPVVGDSVVAQIKHIANSNAAEFETRESATNEPAEKTHNTEPLHGTESIDWDTVVALLPNIKKLAWQQAKSADSVDDAIQAAVLGVAGAVGRYDAERGVKLISFLSLRAKGAVIDELRKGSLIRQPRSLAEMYRIIRLAKEAQPQIDMDSLPDSDLANLIGVTVEQVRDYRINEALITIDSIDASITTESSNETVPIAERLPAEVDLEKSVQDQASATATKLAVSMLLESCEARTADIIRRVHGMDMYEETGPMTLSAVGRIYGISESRVSQIVSTFYKKTRRQLEAGDTVLPLRAASYDALTDAMPTDPNAPALTARLQARH